MATNVLDLVSAVFVGAGLLSALIVLIDLKGHPQSMKIMNSVWVLTALWGGFLALWVYYGFGRAGRRPPRPQTLPVAGAAQTRRQDSGSIEPDPMRSAPISADSMKSTPMRSDSMQSVSMQAPSGVAGMGMKGGEAGEPMSRMQAMPETSEDPNKPEISAMPPWSAKSEMSPMSSMSGISPMPAMAESGAGMSMGAARPFWQSALISSLHCGAGCTLADLIGEWFVFLVPVAIGGSLLGGAWTLDYALALLIGVGFQYAAIQAMGRLPRKEAVSKAVKADFFSLTAWQIGMYGWMALAIFGFFGGVAPRHDSWTFWFMMQLAMLAGLAVAYPVNRLLIRRGIKRAM